MFDSKDEEINEMMQGFIGHKPLDIEKLQQRTSLSKKYIQMLYSGFKECSPSGLATKDDFIRLYMRHFPHSESTEYASLVFNSIGKKIDSYIDFETFLYWYDTMQNGPVSKRIDWLFTLYDVNKDGLVDFEDLKNVITAIYGLAEVRKVEPSDGQPKVKKLNRMAFMILNKLDADGDGVLSRMDFHRSLVMDHHFQSNVDILLRDNGDPFDP